MKRVLVAGCVMSAFIATHPTHAQTVTVTEGKVVILAVDPSDLVIQLDKPGRCGSSYFHVQRTNQNFKEMTALAMTAFASDKGMAVFVTSCSTDRNIISHGYTGR